MWFSLVWLPSTCDPFHLHRWCSIYLQYVIGTHGKETGPPPPPSDGVSEGGASGLGGPLFHRGCLRVLDGPKSWSFGPWQWSLQTTSVWTLHSGCAYGKHAVQLYLLNTQPIMTSHLWSIHAPCSSTTACLIQSALSRNVDQKKELCLKMDLSLGLVINTTGLNSLERC